MHILRIACVFCRCRVKIHTDTITRIGLLPADGRNETHQHAERVRESHTFSAPCRIHIHTPITFGRCSRHNTCAWHDDGLSSSYASRRDDSWVMCSCWRSVCFSCSCEGNNLSTEQYELNRKMFSTQRALVNNKMNTDVNRKHMVISFEFLFGCVLYIADNLNEHVTPGGHVFSQCTGNKWVKLCDEEPAARMRSMRDVAHNAQH